MQRVKRINALRDWIPSFLKENPFTLKKGEPQTGRCCISFSANEFFILHINKIAENIDIVYMDTLPYEESDNLSLLLASIVEEHQLKNIPAYWLLEPSDYQLFLIESMPVVTDEFQAALSWRVRSLITDPITDVTIDSFMLPPKKSTPDNPITAAIVAKTKSLAKRIEVLKKSGLYLTTIDIPELALRNLTNEYENDEKSSAFIYFYEDSVLLNITKQKILYFTRRFTLTSPDRAGYEQLSLDILRYFDYFQSQWRFPSPSRVFVAGENIDIADACNALSEYLLLTVQAYSLTFIKIDQEKVADLQKKYLLALGCALRGDNDHATAGN